MNLIELKDWLLFVVSQWLGTTIPRVIAVVLGLGIVAWALVAIRRRQISVGRVVALLLGVMMLAAGLLPPVLHQLAQLTYPVFIRIIVGVVSAMVIGLTLESIRRTRLQEQYALLWLLTGAILLFGAFSPDFLNRLGSLFGIEYMQMVMVILFVFMLTVTFFFSLTFSRHEQRQNQLAQYCAALEARLKALEGNAGIDAHAKTPHVEMSIRQAAIDQSSTCQASEPLKRRRIAILPHLYKGCERVLKYCGHKPGGCVMMAIIAGIAIAQVRTLTYASGTDVMTYVRAANDFLAGAWPPPGEMPYAPGFVLILAAAIRVGGAFAPYWVNSLFLAGAFYLLMKILELLFSDRRLAAVCTLLTFAGLVCLYSSSLHFLLLPFRETTSLFFIALGYYALLYACLRRWHPMLMVAAGVFALIASGIREPSIIAFAGPAIYLLVGQTSYKRRIARLFYFVLPGLLALGAVMLTAHGRHLLVNNQANTWMNFLLADGGLRAWLNRWNPHGIRSWQFLREMITVPGLCVLVVGAGCAIKSRRSALLLLYGVPSVLLFLFYALLEAHPRYMLVVQWFLLPLMAYGVICPLLHMMRVMTRSQLGPSIVYGGVSVVSIVWLGMMLPQIETWGPRVNARQIRMYQERLGALPDDAVILHAPYSRHAICATMSFSRRDIQLASAVNRQAFNSTNFGVIASRNAEAFFVGGYYPYLGLTAERIVDQFADVEPITLPDGGESRFWMGDEEYELLMSKPWSQTTNEAVFTPDYLLGDMIWLDFRSTPADAKHTISLLDAVGDQLEAASEISGGGLVPVYVPPALQQRLTHIITTSTHPLPRTLLIDPSDYVTGDHWLLGPPRRVSVANWLVSPTVRAGVNAPWAGALQSEGALRVPVPASMPPGGFRVVVIYEPRFRRDQTVTFVYRIPGQEHVQFIDNLNIRYIVHELPIAAIRGESHIRIEIDAADMPPDNHSRFYAIGIVPAVDRLDGQGHAQQ